MKAHHLLLLLPLALAACGPDAGYSNLTCRNATASVAPGARPAAYDQCTAHLFENTEPNDKGGAWHNH